MYHDYIFKQSGMKNSLLIQANKNNLRVRAHRVLVYEEMQIWIGRKFKTSLTAFFWRDYRENDYDYDYTFLNYKSESYLHKEVLPPMSFYCLLVGFTTAQSHSKACERPADTLEECFTGLSCVKPIVNGDCYKEVFHFKSKHDLFLNLTM